MVEVNVAAQEKLEAIVEVPALHARAHHRAPARQRRATRSRPPFRAVQLPVIVPRPQGRAAARTSSCRPSTRSCPDELHLLTRRATPRRSTCASPATRAAQPRGLPAHGRAARRGFRSWRATPTRRAPARLTWPRAVDVDPERVLVTAGGDDLLQRVALAYLGPRARRRRRRHAHLRDDPASRRPWRGARLRERAVGPRAAYPIDAHGATRDAPERTGVVFLVTPNNPTGLAGGRPRTWSALAAQRRMRSARCCCSTTPTWSSADEDLTAARPRAAERGCAAHPVQSLGPGRPAGGLRPGIDAGGPRSRGPRGRGQPLRRVERRRLAIARARLVHGRGRTWPTDTWTGCAIERASPRRASCASPRLRRWRPPRPTSSWPAGRDALLAARRPGQPGDRACACFPNDARPGRRGAHRLPRGGAGRLRAPRAPPYNVALALRRVDQAHGCSERLLPLATPSPVSSAPDGGQVLDADWTRPTGSARTCSAGAVRLGARVPRLTLLNDRRVPAARRRQRAS